ncbi:CRTAC1 family protein [bacterium]|nr:CRTAC1 family protein [candidate division CSSED10-310 bacterium]
MKTIICVWVACASGLVMGVCSGQSFVEVTDALGLSDAPSMRISVADLNGDDYPDLFVHDDTIWDSWDVMNRMYIYLNCEGDTPGTRTFVDFTEASGIRANRRNTQDGRHSDLAIFADVDNDGDLDYFAGMYYHRLEYIPDPIDWIDYSDLFLNDGSGRFTLSPDMTLFNTGRTNVSSAVFTDYDCDGCIDLWVGNWFLDYAANVFAPEYLFRGNGDGSFTDMSQEAGIHDPAVLQPSYGAAVADVDDDGFPDLFVGNYCRDKSKHFRNNGDGTFTEIHESSNYGQYVGPGNCASHTCSWGCMPRDFDNDGDIDMFVILTHGCKKVLSAPGINDGTGVFTWNFDCIQSRLDDDPKPMHHGDHYATWTDWNNDGLVDVMVTENGYENNRFYLFQHQPDHTLQVITPSTAMAVVNTDNMPVHNASAFDYDLDGDDDIIIGAGGDWPIRVFRNDSGNQKNHLTVTLKGVGGEGFSNGAAIGAKIQVTCGSDTYTRVVRAGDGHFGPQVPLRLNVGLNTATRVDTVKITWPNRTRTTYRLHDIAVNQHLRIYEHPDPINTGSGVRLILPATYIRPGDRFSAWGYLYNGTTQTMADVPVMALLEVAGMFWFWDGWTSDVDFARIDVEPGVTLINIMPEFVWPDTGSGAFDGIRFFAAMLTHDMTDILGGLDGLGIAEFGYGP